MLKQFKYKEIIWLDLESPTPTELDSLTKKFSIHPLVLNELSTPSERSKVDVYNDFIYLVLHFPHEVDFILGKNYIITVHYELVNSLNDFSKIFETDFILKKNHDKIHAGFIFFYIIKEIYASLETSLNLINKRLKLIEDKVFSGQEEEVVKSLSVLNRELLDYQWATKTHKEILESFQLAGEELFGEKFRYYLRATSGENHKIWKMIESSRATFNDLRSTNESLLSIKNTETTKMLTVIAFIFLPLNLVAQLFGATRLSLGLMIALSVSTIWLAKVQKWL